MTIQEEVMQLRKQVEDLKSGLWATNIWVSALVGAVVTQMLLQFIY